MTTTKQTEQERLQEIGRNAYSSIVEMVAALQCDYERLEELRGERDDWNSEHEAEDWAAVNTEDYEELIGLEDAAGECEDEDDARQRIMEDPLSLQLRSGWYSPGETPEPHEFELLLATGGPAVRIIGELGDHNEPECPRLQAQDWFTPWTDYLEADQETLLAYCRVFYFGE